MNRAHLKYYLAAFVAVITFVVYLPALRNEFVGWDDNVYIFENPHIRTFDSAFVKWAFLEFYAANWHPLTWLSHALDYTVWGLNPLGHHLTNIVLHAVNTFLVVLLVLHLLEAWKERTAEARPRELLTPRAILIAAGITGLLFGIHPVHVESVAWVAERKDLLCALFFLLSIMTYTTYVSSRQSAEGGSRERGTGGRTSKDGGSQLEVVSQPSTSKNRQSTGLYLLALGFFILALLSKPMAVSLPVVLLILDWHPFDRIRSFRTFWTAGIEKLPFFALSLALSVVTVLAQRSERALQPTELTPVSTRLFVAAKALVVYLGKMLWPLDLVPFYPYPRNISFLSAEYIGAIVLVAGITTACVIAAKKQRLWQAAWCYYGVALLPVLGIVQVGGQSMADRYTYLPGLGPFLVMALGGAWVSEKAQAVKKGRLLTGLFSVVAAVSLVAVLSYLTVKQISIWRNTIDLWSYVISKDPDNVPVAYHNRGLAFGNGGRFDSAIRDFDRAIALDPLYEEAFFNRGVFLARAGSLDKALDDFNRAIALNPYYVDAYVNRGVTYEFLGQYGRGLEDFTAALRLDQNNAAAYFNRGTLYVRTGNSGLGLSDFQKACELGNKNGCNAFDQLTRQSQGE